MSTYRNHWVEALKNQQQTAWNIDIHGQAIVINVPLDEDFAKIKEDFSKKLENIKTEISLPEEWLKFIIYNQKGRFEYIINPELQHSK